MKNIATNTLKKLNLWSAFWQSSWVEKTSHPSAIRLFAIIFNIWILFNFIILSQAHEHFWSTHAYLEPLKYGSFSFFEKITGILWLSEFSPYYPAIIGLQFLSSLLVIFNIKPFFFQVIASWCLLTLDAKSYAIMDGGNNLIHLFAIYLPLMLLAPELLPWKFFKKERVLLANGVFLIGRLQVIAVYLCAGLSKVHGELWPKGVALYYTMGVQEYGHPELATIMSLPFVLVLATYSTVFFQISFPFLVWNRFLRPFYLLAGTFFHLGIVFAMGLVSFGFAMCSSYFIFYTDQKAQRTLIFLNRLLFNTPIYVGIDENCSLCQKIASWIRHFDWKNKVVIDQAHEPKHPRLRQVATKVRIQKMHSVSEKQISSGYRAFYKTLLRLPLCKPLFPLFILLDFTQLGELAYRKATQSSWRKNCVEGHCEL